MAETYWLARRALDARERIELSDARFNEIRAARLRPI